MRHPSIALAVAVLLAACAGALATQGASPTQTPVVATPRSDRPSAHCEAAPTALVEAISTGLVRGTNLTGARMVRDPKRPDVWLIAAEIDGPGIAGPGEVGVWATDQPEDPVTIYSVDAFALEFSDWPRIPDPSLSERAFARACL